ncbi:MAG: lysophospholipid acyltransferase family protein [Dokdonella sp.]
MNAHLGASRLPPEMPQSPTNVWRMLCGWMLRRSGWRLAGEFPNCSRLVLIAAPHSSWWDGVWGLLLKTSLGADIAFMAKRELFRGPLGWTLRRLGGLPVERSAMHGVVEQMVDRFREQPRLWLGIAPEGTRQQVTTWKSGFWHIARRAQVPILPVYFDYPSRTIGIGPLFEPTGDMPADIAALRAFYRPFRGKYRGT